LLILWLAISTVHQQNNQQQNIIFCNALRTTTPYKLQSTTAITPTMTVDLKDKLKALLFIFKGIATNRYKQHPRTFFDDLNRNFNLFFSEETELNSLFKTDA
jgi:hypothetical protein